MRWKIALIIVVVVLLTLLGVVLYQTYRPVILPAPVTMVVHRGETTGQVATRLDSLGLLRSRRLFILWAKYKKIDRQLRPGRYEFQGRTSIPDLVASLQLGSPPIKVTIPEGWTLPKIAARFARELGTDSAAFMAETRATSLLHRFDATSDRLEGYLLPETYEFHWGATPIEVIERMAESQQAIFTDSLVRRMADLSLNRHEILTMASMIEAETADSTERRHIAGVFYNRLRIGMPMQCDPTVVYAIGGLTNGRALLTKDLEVDSPYNTYLYAGLPPGPICNPGRDAILAALYPDSTKDLYFVADGMGHHIFSRSLEQHNLAKMRVHRNLNRNRQSGRGDST
jgi:UPF0755 protein